MFRQFVSTLAFLSLAAITLALPASAQEFLAETMPGEVVLAPEGEYLLESPAMMGPEACCAPLGQAYDVFAPCHFPRWFGHAENLWLKRDTGDNLVFVTGINNGNVFALGTRELMFDHEPGLRTSIGYALNCHTYIEASYFGLFVECGQPNQRWWQHRAHCWSFRFADGDHVPASGLQLFLA